jgi:hypothetical protein
MIRVGDTNFGIAGGIDCAVGVGNAVGFAGARTALERDVGRAS